MKAIKAREIIIEFERIQIIRKRAKTHLRNCPDCRTQADFVSLPEAARLFNSTADLLFQFIRDTGSHYRTETDGGIFICLNSLLGKMRDKTINGAPRLKLTE